MAATDAQIARESVALACLASLSALLGALIVLFVVSRPTLNPRLYGVLKSFLAGAVNVVMLYDIAASRLDLNGWAFFVGGLITVFVVAPLTINPPSGPNKLHPSLTDKEEPHELQGRGLDSPVVGERAVMGGMVVAVAIGLRNFACGGWTFSFLTWRRAEVNFDPFATVSNQAEFVALGAAVAVPIYFGTKSRCRAIQAVMAATAAYPLGQFMAASARPSPTFMLKLLELQAGSMSVVTLYWMFMTSLETTPWLHSMSAWLMGLVCMIGIRFESIVWALSQT